MTWTSNIYKAAFYSFFAWLGASSTVVLADSTDITSLGGDLSSTLPGRNAIQVGAPNVSDRARFERQLSGFAVFHDFRTSPDGLGPNFVNNSCGGCHVNNGKGPARFSRTKAQGSSMVVKIALKGRNPDGSPKDVPGFGEQLQDHTETGKRTSSVVLKWIPVPGRFPDGKKFNLRKPELTISLTGRSSRGVITSLRMTPLLIGLGLLDGVSEATILERADPKDADRDGISGKPQYVLDTRTKQARIGKFGFRASHTTVEEQSAAAAFFDMGVTTSLFGADSATAELSDDDLDRLTVYQTLAGVPFAREQTNPVVIAGRARFEALGCEKCHRTTMTTGEVPGNPELSNQTFHPFSDLLLHDMGPELADQRAEFAASGREWRTTPLWGLGFAESVSTVKPLFIHDGRARTIEEAILWHGGEADQSKKSFMKLKRSERDELITFLRSL